MKPIDFSRATFADISRELGELRMAVWRALQSYGPCTTAELAAAMEMDLLTVRPRVTELMSVGLIVLDGDRRGREVIYRALPVHEAAAVQQAHPLDAPETQLDLRIHA